MRRGARSRREQRDRCEPSAALRQTVAPLPRAAESLQVPPQPLRPSLPLSCTAVQFPPFAVARFLMQLSHSGRKGLKRLSDKLLRWAKLPEVSHSVGSPLGLFLLSFVCLPLALLWNFAPVLILTNQRPTLEKYVFQDTSGQWVMWMLHHMTHAAVFWFIKWFGAAQTVWHCIKRFFLSYFVVHLLASEERGWKTKLKLKCQFFHFSDLWNIKVTK